MKTFLVNIAKKLSKPLHSNRFALLIILLAVCILQGRAQVIPANENFEGYSSANPLSSKRIQIGSLVYSYVSPASITGSDYMYLGTPPGSLFNTGSFALTFNYTTGGAIPGHLQPGAGDYRIHFSTSTSDTNTMRGNFKLTSMYLAIGHNNTQTIRLLGYRAHKVVTETTITLSTNSTSSASSATDITYTNTDNYSGTNITFGTDWQFLDGIRIITPDAETPVLVDNLTFAQPVTAAPTTQTSAISFSNTTGITSRVQWTNGDGDAVAVFMAATNTGNPAPVDGTAYTANTAFSSGTQIGTSGWYCVYNGTGTAVNVTGLSTGTTYRTMVITYNGATGYQTFNNTETTNIDNFTTIAEPTVQASSLTATPDYTNFKRVTFNWTNGNGAGRAVFVRNNVVNTQTTVAPVNNVTYTAVTDSATMGSSSPARVGNTGWYCVYRGTSPSVHSVTMTRITNGGNQNFSVMVVEYNGTTASETYNLSSAGTNAISYINANKPLPVTTGASNLTTTAATLTGTVNPRMGNISNITFTYSSDISMSPVLGTITTVTPSATSIIGSLGATAVTTDLTGLTTGATYYYTISATNNVGTLTTAAQLFNVPNPPTFTSFSPSSGSIGTLVTITGTNLDSAASVSIGGQQAVIVSSSATAITAMVMPGTVNGAVSATVAGITVNGGSSFTVMPVHPPSQQQGSKLVGTGAIGSAHQGTSSALSADGNTLVVGGADDNSNIGAAWVFVRIGNTWTQQAKLTGNANIGDSQQGFSVAINADGNTVIVGGYGDNTNTGAAWVFNRNNGVWTEETKLIPTSAHGGSYLGVAVGLSADGNTAAVGGALDGVSIGATWVFTRSNGVWAEKVKLIGTGNTGQARQGYSVAVSADANTIAVGAYTDNGSAGAVWVFTYNGNTWVQQGNKLAAAGEVGAGMLGSTIAISADGNTIISGANFDDGGTGAAWVFTRDAGAWTQQGNKLVAAGITTGTSMGRSVALSADGNTAIIGGSQSAWTFTRTGSTWTQQDNALSGTGGVGTNAFGKSVTMSSDGTTAVVGAQDDNSLKGAAWVFIAASPDISTDSPVALNATYGAVSAGSIFNVSGSNLFDDITITAPTGFEISTSAGSGFGNNVTLTQTAGTVSSTAVYVRLLATLAADNYTGNITLSTTAIADVQQAVSGTVAPAALTITANNVTKTYGESLSDGSGSTAFTPTGLKNLETVGSISISYTAGNGATAAATTYTGAITPSLAGGGTFTASNYTISYAAGDVTVNPAPISITAATKTKTYGDADPTLNYNITSGALVGTDAFTGNLSRDAGEDVDTYAITQGTLTLGANYNLSYTGANLTIGKKTISVSAAAKTKTYGDADPVLTYSNDALVGSDTFTGTLTRDAGESVDNYAITQGTLALSSNYTLTFTGNNLTIGKKTINVSAAAKTKTYGDADPALTYTNDALVGSDTFTGTLTRDAGENVANYAITQGTLALNTNYNLNYTGANLAIGKKTINVSAATKTKTYGDADPALTYTNDALIGSDTFTGTITRDAGENAGTYSIKQGTLALTNNYNLIFANNSLTIDKKALVITADDQTKLYGTANPVLTATYSGFVNGDNSSSLSALPTITTTAGTGSLAGTYPITANNAAGANYSISYVAGTLNITGGTLTITAVNAAKIYGSANPAFGVTYSGFLNGDTQANITTQPIITTTANTASGVGSYPITVSGAVIPGYTIVYVPATLTVNKATLNVTADNKARIYGLANPPLTVSYNGFVNDDTQANLTTAATATTSATTNSQPGSYDIVAGGAVSPNYTFTYAKGTLTVTPVSIAGLSNLSISSGILSPAFAAGTFTYTTRVGSDIESTGLTPVLADATATININGISVGNGSLSSAIPLNVGSNTIRVTVTAQDGITKSVYTLIVYRDDIPNQINAANILTPNGDGKNDTWVIKDIELYPNNKVIIYDKGGRVVYNKHGYNNDWSGTLQGAPLPSGTYYYVVDFGVSSRISKGFITLLRNSN